jgi:hypothetical protein
MEINGNVYKGKNWICMPENCPIGGGGGVVATAMNIRILGR